jgi:RimJ/RimL family protein N-acetyltransferase
MTLVACLERGGIEKVVAWASYHLDPVSGFAEVAFVVDDEFQQRGIATHLMRRLIEIAIIRGVRGFSAQILSGNVAMLRVFEKCGYPIEQRFDREVTALRILFDQVARTNKSQRGGST